MGDLATAIDDAHAGGFECGQVDVPLVAAVASFRPRDQRLVAHQDQLGLGGSAFGRRQLHFVAASVEAGVKSR